MFQLRLLLNHDLEDQPLDFSTVSGSSLSGEEGKRTWAHVSLNILSVRGLRR
jgi:hypothetical protein